MAHWRKLAFFALIVAQERRCFLCGESFDPVFCERREVQPHQRHNEERITFDHLRPRALAGPDHWQNVCLAHQRCNVAKGDRLPTASDFDRLFKVWHRVPKTKRDEIQAQWFRQQRQSAIDRGVSA